MKTEQLLELLGNPEIFEINKLSPRAYKKSYDLENISKEKSLAGDWHFKYIENVRNRDEMFYLNSKQFKEKIPVPSHIELNGYGQIQYVNVCYPWDGHQNIKVGELPENISVGQYKREFFFEKDENSLHQIICFEGVEQAFNLWINECYVGYSEDSFTESEFDITDFLHEGLNTIAVEVYQYTSSSWLEGQDFWRFFGIFRNVLLKEISNNSIIDFDIKYDLNVVNKEAEINIDIDVTNDQSVYRLEIFNQDQCLFSTNLEQQTVFKLDNLQLWTCETPNLYDFIFISDTEKFIHRVGFRKIEFINKVLCINEERVVFKGINRHEFNCLTGRAISQEDIKTDIELIKSNNFNAIRTSHYPNHPYFYELCDELGLYVIDEANLETHGTWLNGLGDVTADTALPDNNSKYRNNVLSRMKNMYERDKNFTSVISWSLGNESYGGKVLYEASEYFRNIDNSRFVHYEGISWDRRFNHTSDIESRMYTQTEELSELLDSNPEKPIIMCEYSHAMGNSNGNINDYLALEEQYDQYQGGFIWEFMDQALMVDGKYCYGGDFDDRPTDYDFICDGLFGPNREVKPDTEYIALQFSPLKITEADQKLILESKLQFAKLEITIEENIYCDGKFEKINEKKVVINPGKTIEINKRKEAFVRLDLKTSNYKLQSYSYGLKIPQRENKEENEKALNFIDTPFYFSVKDEASHVMFSKVKNNLVSIKFEGIEIFKDIDSTFIPNFWHAPTSNDKGANKHKELSIWAAVSKYSKSTIKNYGIKDNKLIVEIEFEYDYLKGYSSTLKYIINSDCSFDLQFKTVLPTDIPAPFNAGLIASFKPDIFINNFVGFGPFDSYVDRKSNMQKSLYSYEMSDGYFVPQEFGNKTCVNYVEFEIDDTSLFTIKSIEEIEMNYKKYTDEALEQATHRYDLLSNCNQLKLNAQCSGVGGDDSWMTWCKEKYQLIAGEEYVLNLHIGREKNGL